MQNFMFKCSKLTSNLKKKSIIPGALDKAGEMDQAFPHWQSDWQRFVKDPELGYPKMVIRFLPSGLRGMMLASFLAAFMSTVTATEARAKLYRLIDQAASSHEPILITGKRANAILISEDDWRAIQETLHLLSIPGLRESIRKGLETPVEECAEDLDW